MSRIGKVPIDVPKEVQITISSAMEIKVKGPKGENVVSTLGNVKVSQDSGTLVVERHHETAQDRAFHGLYHRLITNAIAGVTRGYSRTLEVVGVGFKAEMQGEELVLRLGRSHAIR
ncbi:50S ribosomal protein L6, partial [Candidatus Sumerlaeota bacterium]|nr:50S ribosomal protein L6 [Candidatus Sumerlaeota bacterium]